MLQIKFFQYAADKVMTMETAVLLVWFQASVKTSVLEQHIESPECFHLANVARCLLTSLSCVLASPGMSESSKERDVQICRNCAYDMSSPTLASLSQED